jgi:hypothetical protein
MGVRTPCVLHIHFLSTVFPDYHWNLWLLSRCVALRQGIYLRNLLKTMLYSVFWGAAIVIFLAKIINFHNANTQGFWIEVSSQVETGMCTSSAKRLLLKHPK